MEQEKYELSQIFFVSIVSLAFVVAYSNMGGLYFFPLYLSSVSANSCISWMTFLKKRSQFSQSFFLRLIRWLISTIAGLIPLAPFLVIVSPLHLDIFSVVAIVLGGFFSMALKEILGRTTQAAYRCAVCGLVQEKAHHCSLPAQYASGLRWLDIDRVHVISVALGSTFGFLGGTF